MKNIIREYFYYSKLERNGIFVLVFLCLLTLLFPKIYQTFNKTASVTDFNDFKNEIASFEKGNNTKAGIGKAEKNLKLFLFDPNTVSESELQKLGLSTKVAGIIQNYRSKGGKFFKKEDFKKIYGIEEDDYLRLEKFIQIEQTQKNFSKEQTEYEKVEKETLIEPFEFDPNTSSKEELHQLGFSDRAANNLMKFRAKGGQIRNKQELSKIYGVEEALYEKLLSFIVIPKKVAQPQPQPKLENEQPSILYPPVKEDLVILDINTASVEDWQKLSGIGPFYAKRIVKFREKLGGFHNVNQVGETYNLPDSTFQKIIPQLQLSTVSKQLNLNTISYEGLANHPYINYNQAKIIINYRQQHGPFKDLNDLEKIVVLTPEIIEKIRPYLSLE